MHFSIKMIYKTLAEPLPIVNRHAETARSNLPLSSAAFGNAAKHIRMATRKCTVFFGRSGLFFYSLLLYMPREDKTHYNAGPEFPARQFPDRHTDFFWSRPVETHTPVQAPQSDQTSLTGCNNTLCNTCYTTHS